MRYKTKQREQVLEIFKKHKGQHLNVDFLLKEIKEQNLDISRATLYRCLDLLVSSGVLKKITVDDKNPPCYQLCELEDHDHFHLVCEECGALIHLECEKVEELVEHINEEHHFEINPSRIVLYGLCENCLNKKSHQK